MPISDNGYVYKSYSRSPRRQSYLDPKDHSVEEIVEREHILRRPGVTSEQRIVELHKPREHPDLYPAEHRRPSRSANPQHRELVFRPKSHRRRYSAASDSDSDYDTDGSSPPRVRSAKQYGKHLPVAHPGPVYANHPGRSRSTGPSRSRSRGPPGPPRRYDSESDSSSDSDGGKKAQPKPPPKQILYTGLACVATIAAANNIYQSAKAHHTRKKELEEGELSVAEAEKLKAQARKLDLISLGVAAVGAYNVRNGWRRAEGHWKAHKEKQAEGMR